MVTCHTVELNKALEEAYGICDICEALHFEQSKNSLVWGF